MIMIQSGFHVFKNLLQENLINYSRISEEQIERAIDVFSLFGLSIKAGDAQGLQKMIILSFFFVACLVIRRNASQKDNKAKNEENE